MNQEQIKSTVRSFVIAFGGYAAGKQWITADQMSFFASNDFITTVASVVSLAAAGWGIYTHSQTNTVAVVAAMPEVAKVETTATPAGKALAENVGTSPQAVVTVAPQP